MTVREALDRVLGELSEQGLREVLDFANSLHARDVRGEEERADWRAFGLSQLAKAYGPDEPDYSEADLKPEPR